MAIVNVTGISGINSITAQSTSLNFFDSAGNNLPITAATLNVGTGASVSSPATNVLTLGTNNTEVVRIDSSGNFGIGGGAPGGVKFFTTGQTYLTNTGSSNIELTLNCSGTNYAHFYDSGGAENTLLFGGSASVTTRPSSPIMSFGLSSGAIGIGTATVASGFRVEVQDIASNYAVKVRNPANTQSIRIGASNPEIASTGNDFQIRTTDAYSIQFWTNNTSRFIVNPSGALGVGSTTDYGTSGKVLTSQGSSASPQWILGGKLVGYAVSNNTTAYTDTTGNPYAVVTISYTTKLASTASDIIISGIVAHGLGPAGTNLDPYGLTVTIKENSSTYSPGQYSDVFAGSGSGVSYGPEWDIRTTSISLKSTNVWSAGDTITYTLIADGDSTGGIFINRCTAYTTNRGTSSLTIMEIAK